MDNNQHSTICQGTDISAFNINRVTQQIKPTTSDSTKYRRATSSAIYIPSPNYNKRYTQDHMNKWLYGEDFNNALTADKDSNWRHKDTHHPASFQPPGESKDSSKASAQLFSTHLKLLLLIIVCIPMAMGTPTKVLKGATTEELQNFIFYEATVPLVYEINIPKFNKIQIQGNSPTIKQINNVIRKAQENLRTLLSHEDSTVKTRTKRGLTILGEWYEWCCGVVSEKTFNHLAEEETNLEQYTEKLKTQLSADHTDLIQITKLVNEYSVNIDKNIEQIESHVLKDLKKIGLGEQGLEIRLNDISNALNNLADAWLESTITMTWQKVLSDCRDGHIPHSLITFEIMERDLIQIQNTLTPKNKQLSINISSLGRYYDTPMASCSFSEDTILIHLKIPIMTKKSTYKLWKLTPIPFKHFNSICSIPLQNQLVIQHNNHHVTLTGDEVNDCDLPNKFCFMPKFSSQLTQNPKCISLLLRNNATANEIRQHCTLTCTDYTEDTPNIFELKRNSYGIINPQNSILIQCPSNNTTIPPLTDIGIHTIDLPCECSLHFNSIIIPPDFPCPSSLIDEVSIHVSIPSLWTTMNASIINDKSIFNKMSEILNEQWHESLPHLNLTAHTDLIIEDLIPQSYTLGNHLSFISTIWAIIITLWTTWLTLKIIGSNALAIPLSFFPTVRADTDIPQLIEYSLLIIIVFVLILILILIQYYINQKWTLESKSHVHREVNFADDGTIKIIAHKLDSIPDEEEQ